MNLRKYAATPKNDFNSFEFDGRGNAITSFTFDISGSIPVF